MSKCTIEISNSNTESIDELIGKVKNRVSDKGGSFDGNSESGNYSIPTKVGKIKGTYQVKEKSIHLEITDKPIFIGCEIIKNKLKKHLSSDSE